VAVEHRGVSKWRWGGSILPGRGAVHAPRPAERRDACRVRTRPDENEPSECIGQCAGEQSTGCRRVGRCSTRGRPRQRRPGALARRSMPTRRCPCDCAAWCIRCMYTQSLQSLAAYGRRLASQPQANPDSTQPSRVRPPSSRFIAARTSYLSSHRSSTHSARSSIHRLSSTVAPHPQARRVRVSTARAVQGRAGTVDPVDSPPNTPPSRRRPPPSTLASASASSTGGSVRRGRSA